ncbi:ATP-binding cassette, subfamily B [Nonomuraea solani]|uniref:ATP-binding cassette, subfamily B n=1 Tax=Nonomuraea solani TaxID=1144553 RepID=A0A1H6ETQ6_9ACTN|nr:ABC transporter ATP-binding protein [Nonomuraea solani]SEH00209.1 ATP-binding cassette, subfamily B [Nonomuraea solani]
MIDNAGPVAMDRPPNLSPGRYGAMTRSAIRLIRRTSPKEAALTFGLEALIALSIPLQLLLVRWVIGRVVGVGGQTTLGEIVVPIIAIFAVFALTRILLAVAMGLRLVLPKLVSYAATEMLAAKAAALPLPVIEAPDTRTRLAQAQRDIEWRPLRMCADLILLVSSGVTIAGLLVLLVVVQPVLAVFVVVAYALMLRRTAGAMHAIYTYFVTSMDRDRKLSYLSTLMADIDAAKEVRCFGLADVLLGRLRLLQADSVTDLRSVGRQWARRYLIGGLWTAVMGACGLVYTLWQYSLGSMTLGAAVAAVGALLFLIIQGHQFASSAGRFYENAVFVENFWWFMDLPAAPTGTKAAPSGDGAHVTLDGVSFTYPGSDRPVLVDVSMEVRPGEIVALVGENGAGKTTLAKLLCGLYEPDTGAVRWNGRDLSDIDAARLRENVSVVFQDFVRYQLPARDNIVFGDVTALSDEPRMVAAAREAGAHDFVSVLPDGYDTVLGPEFAGAHEPSVGQWQRVALARAMFRQAPLMILDEPSAALDGRAEHDLFAGLARAAPDQAVMVISHRMSSVQMADRIYVLKDGRIVEEGRHAELMDRDGAYAELFALHAASGLGDGP